MANEPTFSSEHLSEVGRSYHEEVTRLLELKANLRLQLLNKNKEIADLKAQLAEVKKPSQENTNQ